MPFMAAEADSDKLMVERAAGGGAARGDAQFAVDGGEVRADGAATDDELRRDLRIGQPHSEEAQDISFTRRERIGIAGRSGTRRG